MRNLDALGLCRTPQFAEKILGVHVCVSFWKALKLLHVSGQGKIIQAKELVIDSPSREILEFGTLQA
jgi:hypothetical protein